MTDDARRLLTEEQRERLHTARRQGGQCALCGRLLNVGETVYIEQFDVTRRKTDVHRGRGSSSSVSIPVGIECASADLLRQVEGQEPERCAKCGRGVYYQVGISKRQLALCSRRCRSLIGSAKRAARRKEV